MQVFHIATLPDWQAARRSGSYTTSTYGRSLTDEGFIHGARREQVRGQFHAFVDFARTHAAEVAILRLPQAAAAFDGTGRDALAGALAVNLRGQLGAAGLPDNELPDVLAAMHSVKFAKVVRRSIHLTPFGEDFCRTCLVEEDVATAAFPEHGTPGDEQRPEPGLDVRQVGVAQRHLQDRPTEEDEQQVGDQALHDVHLTAAARRRAARRPRRPRT